MNELTDEIGRLRKDAERLDWFEKHAEKLVKVGNYWYSRSGYQMPMKRRYSFREAIDAAMKETP